MFVEDAVVSGQREVEHAKNAEARASNDSVKAYATRLVAAHTSANEELSALKTQKINSRTGPSTQSNPKTREGGSVQNVSQTDLAPTAIPRLKR